MLKLIYLLVSLVLFAGCNRQDNQSEDIGMNDIGINRHRAEIENIGSGKNKLEKMLTFGDSSPYITLKEYINGMQDEKKYSFDANKGERLHIKIRPDNAPGNVRIKHIISPSGATDGPFGVDIEYRLKESGKWSFIIDESNMVGDEYIGNFILNVSVKE